MMTMLMMTLADNNVTMLMMLLADDDVTMLMMLMLTLSGDKEALLLPSTSLILIIRSESVKWEEERRSLRINDHFVSFPFLHAQHHGQDGERE